MDGKEARIFRSLENRAAYVALPLDIDGPKHIFGPSIEQAKGTRRAMCDGGIVFIDGAEAGL